MGTPRAVKHLNHSYDKHSGNGLDLDGEAIRGLAAAVIEQAVSDWIMMIWQEEDEKNNVERYETYKGGFRQKRTGSITTYSEIRRFFNSDYGEAMCEVIEIAPDRVLNTLEKWLRDYRERGIRPRHIRYKNLERTGRHE